LGYTFLFYAQADDPPERSGPRSVMRVTAQDGFMTRDEVAAEYSRRTGYSTGAIDFYVALAYYKLAIINEGIWARHLKGQTVGEGYEMHGEETVRLMNLALQATEAM